MEVHTLIQLKMNPGNLLAFVEINLQPLYCYFNFKINIYLDILQQVNLNQHLHVKVSHVLMNQP